MNERSLEVLKQYDIEMRSVARGRGGMLIETGSGVKLFLECVQPNAFYERENEITAAVTESGYNLVDTYCKNHSGEIITVDDDGRRYLLKNWFDGRECNTRDIGDICDAIQALARLHTAMENVRVQSAERRGEALCDTYVRHMKELKMASNYLKNKKKRTEFELLAYRNVAAFYEEAVAAVGKLNSPVIKECFRSVYERGELCHGSFNYHNVIFTEGRVAVTNFDKCRNECQMLDLYQFMRKILEKYDWSIELAYKLLDEYNHAKALSQADMELLSAMFAFPEKFWKIINYYLNANKAWIPPKSIEKLKVAVEQNPNRRKFVETLT